MDARMLLDRLLRLVGFAVVLGAIGRAYYVRNADLVGELL